MSSYAYGVRGILVDTHTQAHTMAIVLAREYRNEMNREETI